MNIKCTNTLKGRDMKNIIELIDQCKLQDATTITPNLTSETNFDPELPCFFLCYEQDYLISFISIFMPTPYYGEVVAYTFPAARNRGYFMKTWLEALNVLGPHTEEMEIMFVTDGKSPDALATLAALQCHKEYSEYVMDHLIVENDKATQLYLKPLDPVNNVGDANAVFMMHTNMFVEDRNETVTFLNSVKQEFVNTFLAVRKHDDKPVGILHLALDGDRVFLFGLGVLEHYQRRGYGKQMVQLAMNSCTGGEYINMGVQVSSLNDAAMALYRSCGFREVSRLDYYYDEI